MEKKLEKDLRRCQNILIIVGGGVIILGVWSFMKSIMFYILDASEVSRSVDPLIESLTTMPGSKITPLQIKIAYFGLIFLFFLLEMLFRLYIGRKAIAEARGRKRGYLYILMSFFLVLLNVVAIIGFTNNLIHFKGSPLDYAGDLVTILIEITSMAVTVEMIVAAIRLKSITKQLKRLHPPEPPEKRAGTAPV